MPRVVTAAERCRDVLLGFMSSVGRMEFLCRQYIRLWPVLSRAASFYRKHFLKRTKIIVVVGSFGKSTTARSV